MAKDIITALIIRRQTVEWTSISKERGKFLVVDFKREPLEAGPEASSSEDHRTERLRALCHGLPGTVHVGLPAEDLLLRIVNLPNADPEEMRDIVRLQLDKASPFPLEDMVFSYEVLTPGKDLSRLLMAAATRHAAEEIGEILNKARLRPRRMDAAVMGWQPLLHNAGAFPEAGRHANLILHADGADLWITQDADPLTIRVLHGRNEHEDETAWGNGIILDLRHTLMALELEHGPASPLSCTVWHDEKAIPGWTDGLQQLFPDGLDSRSLDELPPLSEGLARRAAEPGSALLDLTPDQWRATEQDKAFRRKLKRAAQILIALWALVMTTVFGAVYYEETRLQQWQAIQAEWNQPANEVRDLRTRLRMIGQYIDNEHSALECLREVSALLPDGIVLTSLAYRKWDSVNLAGRADTVNQVYQFKSRVDASPLFREALLKGPRWDARARKQVFDMEIALPEEEAP